MAHSLVPSDRVEGTPVYGRNNEKLGTIERLMLDKMSGMVAYAVIKSGGLLAVQHHYPIPWGALRYNPARHCYECELTLEAAAQRTLGGRCDVRLGRPLARADAAALLGGVNSREIVGWAKPRKRHSRPKDGVASLAYAHVVAPNKRREPGHSALKTRVTALVRALAHPTSRCALVRASSFHNVKQPGGQTSPAARHSSEPKVPDDADGGADEQQQAGCALNEEARQPLFHRLGVADKIHQATSDPEQTDDRRGGVAEIDRAEP
jgi:hypothetical protein